MPVALRKESVDRNSIKADAACFFVVALRKESVDRNWKPEQRKSAGQASLSARRAWIEMQAAKFTALSADVALRKESVDRNHGCLAFQPVQRLSLSARRAWIEISLYGLGLAQIRRRSPQGERG